MIARLGIIVAAALALGGCATTYCSREEPYQRAQTVPSIVGTGELKLPNSPTALRIPDAKGSEALTFAYLVPDPQKPGKTKVHCLDEPPPIPPSSDATK